MEPPLYTYDTADAAIDNLAAAVRTIATLDAYNAPAPEFHVGGFDGALALIYRYHRGDYGRLDFIADKYELDFDDIIDGRSLATTHIGDIKVHFIIEAAPKAAA